MAGTRKLIVTVTDEMHEALRRKAAERAATSSGLTRMILAQWLAAEGEEVEWRLEWGGRRKDGREEAEGNDE